MLGGGVFVTQNKVLPGSYINFVNASTAGSTIGERGTVALLMSLDTGYYGRVYELTKADFLAGKFHSDYDSYLTEQSKQMLREVFCHANKVLLVDTDKAGENDNPYALLESYDFNTLFSNYPGAIDVVKTWRDELGKKCQVVVSNDDAPNHEGVVNVVSTATSPIEDTVANYSLCAWVAGALAGCEINKSCTNMLYDGELTIDVAKSQTELENCIKNGQFAFHNVYGEVRVLEDINSLTETTVDKGEDFKSNQTIRVVDQIANDIARLFNTKYLGKIPNNASGRATLWGEIVAHHRELEEIQAIEAFDSSMLTVAQGDSKKSVVVNDAITVVNSMAQLYMTVVIQ